LRGHRKKRGKHFHRPGKKKLKSKEIKKKKKKKKKKTISCWGSGGNINQTALVWEKGSKRQGPPPKGVGKRNCRKGVGKKPQTNVEEKFVKKETIKRGPKNQSEKKKLALKGTSIKSPRGGEGADYQKKLVEPRETGEGIGNKKGGGGGSSRKTGPLCKAGN